MIIATEPIWRGTDSQFGLFQTSRAAELIERNCVRFRSSSRIGVLDIMPLGHIENCLCISNGKTKDGNAIKSPACRYESMIAQSTTRGLQPHDIVESCWDPTRAGSVCAQRERHDTTSDNRGASRAGATTDTGMIE
ncbi:hypothetical protein HG530_011983 [Fusarium avenaceum]|nr:hypothetical protein HG530_011983 [Fusarium avenaceum]